MFLLRDLELCPLKKVLDEMVTSKYSLINEHVLYLEQNKIIKIINTCPIITRQWKNRYHFFLIIFIIKK